MVQNILAITTVTLIIIWGVVRFVRYMRRKDSACGCNGCGNQDLKKKLRGKK